MPSAFNDLIDATVRHLQDLKARGRRFIQLSPESIGTLNAGPSRPVAPSRPSAAAVRPAAPGATERTASQSGSPSSVLPPAAPVRAKGVSVPPELAGAPDAAEAFATTPVLGSAEKRMALRELQERVSSCVKCPNLAAARQQVVFGVGSADAELMFVGEAPGADEDAQGEPFVGAAGQLLTKIIQTMGLSRETVYIANILKCRPDTPGQPTGNRKPTAEEMQTCIPYLHSQIDIIRPKVLVALGGTAMEGLLGKTGITRLRGQWQTFRGIPVMPTFHPSYLLRNMALGEKRKVWEDMLQVMERLQMPVSEKQRGFFLPRAG